MPLVVTRSAPELELIHNRVARLLISRNGLGEILGLLDECLTPEELAAVTGL